METGRDKLFGAFTGNVELFRANLMTYDAKFRTYRMPEVLELVHEYCAPQTEEIVASFVLGAMKVDIADTYNMSADDVAMIISQAAHYVATRQYEEGKLPDRYATRTRG